MGAAVVVSIVVVAVVVVVVVSGVVVVVSVVVVSVFIVVVCDALSSVSTRSWIPEEVNGWVIVWSRSKVVIVGGVGPIVVVVVSVVVVAAVDVDISKNVWKPIVACPNPMFWVVVLVQAEVWWLQKSTP